MKLAYSCFPRGKPTAAKAILSGPLSPCKYSHLGYGLNRCTVLQKEFHHPDAVLFAGDMERGEAVL